MKVQFSARFLDPDKDNETVEVNGCPLTFNHLSKAYWPENGITKRDMFNYYDQVAEYMMPYLKDRPMSLLEIECIADYKIFLYYLHTLMYWTNF